MDMNFHEKSFLECMEIAILIHQEFMRKSADYITGKYYKSEDLEHLMGYLQRAQMETIQLYMDNDFRLEAQKLKYE